MIYYVVAKNSISGDEWIMSSHDNAEYATTALESYRAGSDFMMKGPDGIEFRIDTVMERDEVEAANATIPPPTFEATEESGDYTLAELFGMYAHIPVDVDITLLGKHMPICRECGSVVAIPQRHLDFHNKLLP